MDSPVEFNPVELHRALTLVDGWSNPSTIDQTNVHDGYRQIGLVSNRIRQPAAEPFGFVLDTFEPVFSSWISWIEPHGYIRTHRDAGPWRERWQVPIYAAGWFMQADATFEPVDGVAFKVEHWDRHAIGNPTDRPRIHIVIDRDVWLDRPAEPFRIFEE